MSQLASDSGSCPDTDSRTGERNIEEEGPSIDRKWFGLNLFSALLANEMIAEGFLRKSLLGH
jgi:hypothetical protein